MFIHWGQEKRLIRNNPRHVLRVGSVIFGIALSASAHASLGSDAASVLSDQKALDANGSAVAVAAAAGTNAVSTSLLASSTTGGYTVKTVIQTGGTTIHEYLSSDGAVFAIAWAGPFMPNLRQLLGSYFSTYQTEAAQQRATTGGHGPLAVDDGELVVRSSGGMHNFAGSAYLKSRLPGNVSVDLIR